jgi:DNA mismatch repair protein MLH1
MHHQSDIIAKLPEQTIRLIAAGEVITRPFNVVKELVENSIDAGARNIRVSIEQGGLKSIEVIDNGHGIAKENAKLLCQRHTTSKLSSANELQRISTFGFRGEALSSISEVADVDVTTFNIKCDKMGWHGEYRHGALTKPVNDKYIQLPGTRIKVSELFSNTISRKKSLMTGSLDEKKDIVDLVTKLAIHHRDKITFMLNETGSNELVCSLAPVELGPCIGNFYGVQMESNLSEITIDADPQNETSRYNFKANIHVAFTYKKATSTLHHSSMIIFVNDRLVDCDELKREVGALILEYFGNKQYVSLVYIALKVPPTDIDVNTHPAKLTVTLHYQQEIIALILTEMRAKFNESLSLQVVPNHGAYQKTVGELIRHSSSQNQSSQLTQKLIQEDRLRQLAPNSLAQARALNSSMPAKRPYEQVHNDSTQPSLIQMRMPPNRIRRDMNLMSLAELKERVAKEKTSDLASIKTIKGSVFVGIFDHHRALIQHETKLYAINLKSFVKEQIYQFYLFDFGNFTPIEILPPGNKIQFMIETYLEDIRKHDKIRFEKLVHKTANAVIEELLKHADMYQDYLSIRLTQQEIITIPNIIPEHVPNLAYLGQFLVSLVNDVTYENETDCFNQLGRILADFYSNPPANIKDMRVQRKYHEFVEVRLYDAIKKYLILPEWLLTKQNICQITDTKDLYKVFERC